MKKAHAIKWINALRSGKYKQGDAGSLRDNNDGYCCLGVLDEIFPKLNLSLGSTKILDNYNVIGLTDSSGKLCEYNGNIICLSSLNDGKSSACYVVCRTTERFTFDEIADIIQIEYVEGL